MMNCFAGYLRRFGAGLGLFTLALAHTACGSLSDDRRPTVQVRYTQSGELVVLADRVLTVWDGDLKKQRLSFDLEPSYRTQADRALGVSRDGSLAAVALNDAVVIFDLKSGKKVRTIGASDLDARPSSFVRSIGLSPDGQMLAVATHEYADPSKGAVDMKVENRLLVYRTDTGERAWQMLTPPNESAIDQASGFAPPLFSADGQRLLVRSWFKLDYTVFAAQTGELLGPLAVAGSGFNIYYPSSDHTRVLGYSTVQDASGFVRIPGVWNGSDGTLVQFFPGVLGCGRGGGLWMDASPDQQVFATGNSSKCDGGSATDEVVVWNAEGKVLYHFPAPSFFTLAFSADSTRLAVAGGQDGASVYRLSDGTKLGNRKFDRRAF